jgi:hypothetical protein
MVGSGSCTWPPMIAASSREDVSAIEFPAK